MRTVYGHGMLMGFAEHLSYQETQRLLRVVTHNGKKLTVKQFRALVTEAKAKGYTVFPSERCKNIRPDGDCGGCLVDDNDSVIGPAPTKGTP